MSNFERVKKTPKRTILKLLKDNNLEFSAVLRSLGVYERDPRARKYLKQVALDYDSTIFDNKSKQGRLNYSIEEFKAAIKDSICYSDVCLSLGLAVHGGNYTTLRKLIKQHDIDISHFNRGNAHRRGKVEWTYNAVFCQHSKVPRASLRRLVIKFGFTPEKCEECPIVDTHNDKPLSLTLDHKNGIPDDNRVANLRWLCPNCHSQTENYCGKNK
jgi:hypothetical protein